MPIKVKYKTNKGLFQIKNQPNGGFDIDGYFSSDRTKISTTVQNSDFSFSDNGIVLVDCSGGPVTGTLPDSSQNSIFRAKKIDSTGNPFVLSGSSIDGESNQIITDQYTAITVVMYESDWYII